jgi:hypothetical protein
MVTKTKKSNNFEKSHNLAILDRFFKRVILEHSEACNIQEFSSSIFGSYLFL